MAEWLRRIGFPAAILAAALVFSLGAYVEQGQAGPVAQQRILPPEPADACDAGRTLQQALDGIKVDAGLDVGPLKVYPLRKRGLDDARDVISLDQALAKGWLRVDEKDNGNVPFLMVSNTGPSPVLMMAGEVVVGGRQNRIIRQDTLVPPKSFSLAIPVYCGEQGRWSYQGPQGFGTGGWVANPSTRKAIVNKLDQSAVWEDIDRNLNDQAAAAPTRSMQELTSVDANAKLIEHYDRFVAPKLPADSVGLVVCHRGRIIGLDVFGSPELCQALVTKIMRGYICQGWDQSKPEGVSAQQIQGLLARISDSAFTIQPSVGAGCSALFGTDGLEGEVLLNQGGLIHLVALD